MKGGWIMSFDENQVVRVRWHSSNKKYYTDLGFEFTKIGDEFDVPVKMLTPKSSMYVTCTCDYCGQEYKTRYSYYVKSKMRGKLSCQQCKQEKAKDTFMDKYGVHCVGTSKELADRSVKARIDKYGCVSLLQTEKGQLRFKNIMYEKYGYENAIYCPELRAKAKQSMYENGNVPTSKPEKEMVAILRELYGEENCFAGYPVDKVNLDCLLVVDGVKIDVEYDGWYWHKDTSDYDRKRNHWLIEQGYKIIRVKGNQKEELPTKERIKEEVDYILNGHSLGYIDMNN